MIAVKIACIGAIVALAFFAIGSRVNGAHLQSSVMALAAIATGLIAYAFGVTWALLFFLAVATDLCVAAASQVRFSIDG